MEAGFDLLSRRFAPDPIFLYLSSLVTSPFVSSPLCGRQKLDP